MLLRKDMFFFFILIIWLVTGLLTVLIFNFRNPWIINLGFQGILMLYILPILFSKRWQRYICSESTLFKKKTK